MDQPLILRQRVILYLNGSNERRAYDVGYTDDQILDARNRCMVAHDLPIERTTVAFSDKMPPERL